MKARLTAFVIWAAVAASAMFWLLRLGPSSPAAPAHTVAVGAATAPRGDLARLFGATPVTETASGAGMAQTPLSARFKLLGVAAPRQGGDRTGLALIAVDGKPARSYGVGAAVDGDLLLQAVHARGARLGARGAAPQVTLDLPALPPPATGSLPLAQAQGAPTGLAGAAISTVAVAPPTMAVPTPPTMAVPTPPQQGEPIPVAPPPGPNTR